MTMKNKNNYLNEVNNCIIGMTIPTSNVDMLKSQLSLFLDKEINKHVDKIFYLLTITNDVDIEKVKDDIIVKFSHYDIKIDTNYITIDNNVYIYFDKTTDVNIARIYNNIIKIAIDNDVDWIFFMHSDAVVSKITLDYIKNYKKQKDIIYRCKRIEPKEYGSNITMYDVYINKELGDSYENFDYEKFENVVNIYYNSVPETVSDTKFFNVGMLAHKEVFFDIGLFDEQFNRSYDDLDWFYRLVCCGYIVKTFANVPVFHMISKESEKVGKDEETLFYRFVNKWKQFPNFDMDISTINILDTYKFDFQLFITNQALNTIKNMDLVTYKTIYSLFDRIHIQDSNFLNVKQINNYVNELKEYYIAEKNKNVIVVMVNEPIFNSEINDFLYFLNYKINYIDKRKKNEIVIIDKWDVHNKFFFKKIETNK